MGRVFLGSDALVRRELTRAQLRWNYRTIYPNVYVPRTADPSLRVRTEGAWLWSGERAPITGRAAAALHGALWVADDAPIELLWKNDHPPPGIISRDERFTCGDVQEIDGMAVATIQRTAFDLGRHLRRGAAVAHLDALARATGLAAEHVLPMAELYKGARGVRRLKTALHLMDAGAQSPKETWLRLLLGDAGFPRPTTQIPVRDDSGYPFAFLDMGWEDIMLAVEYDGEHHRTDSAQYADDIRRSEKVHSRGWLVVRVTKQHRPIDIINRVADAWALREPEARAVISRVQRPEMRFR